MAREGRPCSLLYTGKTPEITSRRTKRLEGKEMGHTFVPFASERIETASKSLEFPTAINRLLFV